MDRPQTTAANRRAKARESLLFDLEVFDSDGQWIGHVRDVSDEGLRVITMGPFAPGTEMDLRVAVPPELKLGPGFEASATVRWAKESSTAGYFEFGCQFSDISTADLVKLQQVVAAINE